MHANLPIFQSAHREENSINHIHHILELHFLLIISNRYIIKSNK